MKHFRTEWNPHKEAMERWYWDEDTETMHIKNTFEIGDILEHNKAAAAASLDSRYGNQMMHHVAEIPNVFIVKFMQEHGINLTEANQSPENSKKLRRLLDDPEYRFLKTTTKRLWRPT
jgi:hypothetical protein